MCIEFKLSTSRSRDTLFRLPDSFKETFVKQVAMQIWLRRTLWHFKNPVKKSDLNPPLVCTDNFVPHPRQSGFILHYNIIHRRRAGVLYITVHWRSNMQWSRAIYIIVCFIFMNLSQLFQKTTESNWYKGCDVTHCDTWVQNIICDVFKGGIVMEFLCWRLVWVIELLQIQDPRLLKSSEEDSEGLRFVRCTLGLGGWQVI